MDFEIMGEKQGSVAAILHKEGKLKTVEDVSKYMSELLKNLGQIPESTKMAWCNGFNAGFDRQIELDRKEPAWKDFDNRSDRKNYDNGFNDAVQNILRHPVKDMYNERAEEFREAGKAMSFSELSQYKDGYNAGMVKQIEAIGARQAIHDKGMGGASTQGLEKSLKVITWLKEPGHKEAYANGYKREAELDRAPLESQQQSGAYEKGYKRAAGSLQVNGLKEAVATSTGHLENMKGVYNEQEHHQYAKGFMDGLKNYVQNHAGILATAAAKMPNVSEQRKKIEAHFKNAGDTLPAYLYNVFAKSYTATVKNIEQTKTLPTVGKLDAGSKFEVRQQERKLQEHAISR